MDRGKNGIKDKCSQGKIYGYRKIERKRRGRQHYFHERLWRLNQGNSFVHLGLLVTTEGSARQEIDARVVMGKHSSGVLGTFLRSKKSKGKYYILGNWKGSVVFSKGVQLELD